MSPEERAQFNQMQNAIRELQLFIEQNFNPDGTAKAAPLVIEAEDTTTAAAGSIRIITSKGPKNVLIA
jgi:hypothetical protein